MHIAIDTTPMESAHKNRGIGIYTRNLVEAIEKLKGDNKYTYFTRTQKVPNNVDLIHYPYFDPFFLTLPFIFKIPTIITIHDLIPIVFPKYFPRGIKGEMKWRIQKHIVKNASRIITDSENSKNDVLKYIGIDKSKIDPIYLAPAQVFSQFYSQKIIDSVKSRYSLPKNFLVYVGDINWNKNIPGMLQAFAKYTETNPDNNLKLVLIGKSFKSDDLPEMMIINRAIAELKLNDKIIKLGYVDDVDECIIYSLAQANILVSFYEGFGLPVLEALAAGCPVIAADNSSIREIMGPAIKVNAGNSDSIVKGIAEISNLTDSKRQALIQAGKNWVTKFTWEKTARQTIESYEKANSNYSGL
jgi:glycosyltransferase involved in cell wall biosynthesis